LTDDLIIQYLAMGVAVQNEMNVEQVERYLQMWTPLGLFWSIIQKWVKEYKEDTTNQMYKAVIRIAEEMHTDGLDFLKTYHTQYLSCGVPLDLVYWTLRLHLSTNMNWYVKETAAPLYSWRMLQESCAELHFGIPDGKEQRWVFEVDLLNRPFESLEDRKVFMPFLWFPDWLALVRRKIF
jgi:hypothetical protein